MRRYFGEPSMTTLAYFRRPKKFFQVGSVCMNERVPRMGRCCFERGAI